MSESKAKWDDVGDRFTALGRKLKSHYDANAQPSAPRDEAEQDQVRDALRQISDALDAGFTAIGESLRDTEVRDDFKQAGNAIADALTASIEDVKSAINAKR
jgi:hypothetical protein